MEEEQVSQPVETQPSQPQETPQPPETSSEPVQEEVKPEEKPVGEKPIPEAPIEEPPKVPEETPSQPPTPQPEPPPQTIQPAETPTSPPSPASTSAPIPAPVPDFRVLTRQARIKKKETKLEKLLNFSRQKGKITNNQIQKFLRVSDATASRYSQELIRRGVLRKSGKTKSIYYEPI